MRESIKAVLSLVIIVSIMAGSIAWIMEDKEAKDIAPVVRVLRYVLPVVALLALAILLKIHFRKDDVPDFLRQNFRNYFNRDGFCFAVRAIERGGICFFEMHFQNQFERLCLGMVALRPARGFFLNRAKMDSIIVKIVCGPAAYGIARVAVPIPVKLQGQRHSFEVGAWVKYPEGKGKQLRFHDGIFLRADTNFQNAVGTAMTVAGAMVGHIIVNRPATCKISLPNNVDSEIPIRSDLEPETFWQLGDPLPQTSHT